MDIIGGNKIFFILAICLMGLMFSSCDTHFFKARLESGEINKYHRPLSADIKKSIESNHLLTIEDSNVIWILLSMKLV